MHPTNTWILLADGAHARLLRNLGPGKGLEELSPGTIDMPHPPNRELDSDKPGRVQDSAGPGRHSMEPHIYPHEKLKQDFAKSLADGINSAVNKNRFDRLIVAAPPKILGELRQKLDKNAQSRVYREIDKDLTTVSEKELYRQLEDDLLL